MIIIFFNRCSKSLFVMTLQEKFIDLRSDTVTRPTSDMWEAVRNLKDSNIGDDVFGEDPTVNELELQAAKIMNKESALYVTSGTQGNLISLLSQTNPGEEIMIERKSHIFLYEVGSAARIGGLTSKTFNSLTGFPTEEELRSMIRTRSDLHQPWTTLLAVENTHNTHGGVVIKPHNLKRLSNISHEYDFKFHMDGARIFNAAVATDLPLNAFTDHVDSIMFCLSKGMAAPVGSMVAGSQEFIDRARKFRKMLGGGMRQAGVIAIMGLMALKHDWRAQIKADHMNAQYLANGLRKENLNIDVPEPESNILQLKCPENAPISKIILDLKELGLFALPMKSKIRLVTHFGISKDDINRAIRILSNTISKNINT
jgi:threonine aldolase